MRTINSQIQHIYSENYYALCIAIIKKCNTDDALRKMGIGAKPKSYKRNKLKA